MKRFATNNKGSAIVLGALLMPVLLAFGAFAVDLANLYYNRSKIQAVADTAALGSVLSLPNTSTVTSQALSLVSKNTPHSFGTLSTAQDVVVGYWDATLKKFTPGSVNQNAVEVFTHRSVATGNPILTYFGRFVGTSLMQVNAKAVAVRYGGACVRVLDPSASSALYVGGSGNISMNCAMQINSTSSSAAVSKGSSVITTQSTCVTGGYQGSGWSPTPTTGCQALSDPLAAIAEPAQPSSSCAAPVSGGTIYSDCIYTGSLSLSGNVTISSNKQDGSPGSGVIYFKNASVSVSSNTNVSGTGVTLFLDSTSTLNLGGGGAVTLSAPTTGPYSGILIFQSRSTPSTTTISLGGGGGLSLDGSLYAPTCTLSMSGSSTLTGKVGYAIADKISLGGSSSFAFAAFPTSGATPRTLRVHAGLAL